MSDAVRTEAQHMVTTVAQNPFGQDSDKAFAQVRTLAMMAQELQAQEEKMKGLYGSALAMMVPETPVLTALPGRGKPEKFEAGQGNQEAEDAVIKPTAARQIQTKKVKAKSKTLAPRMSNDVKLMDYLKTVLNRRSWKPVTHAAISQGAGIPLGSVGWTLSRAKQAAHIVEDAKGAYKLA